MGSGTYKIASADFSDKLGQVTCCPGDARGSEVCSKDFKWQSIEGSKPDAFGTCGSPNWVPYSEKQIIKYQKVDGVCESTIKEVACANDFDCKDSNQLCDLNKYECVDADVNLKGQVIETQVDNSADCSKVGGTWISSKTEQKSLLNTIGIGSPTIVTQDYCQLPKGFLDKLFSLPVLVLAFLVIIIFIFRGQLIVLWNATAGRFGLRI